MSAAVDLLQEKFSDEVVEVVEFRGETTIVVQPGKIVEICRTLRDDHSTGFKYLSMIAGLDFLPQSPRFGLVYNLYSHKHHHRITLKTMLAHDAAPAIDSVTKVWCTANWPNTLGTLLVLVTLQIGYVIILEATHGSCPER